MPLLFCNENVAMGALVNVALHFQVTQVHNVYKGTTALKAPLYEHIGPRGFLIV